MNLSNTKAVLTVILAAGFITFMTQSCSKKSGSSAAPMTLYDSLGGTTMVADPANAGAMVEKGYLGIRTIVVQRYLHYHSGGCPNQSVFQQSADRRGYLR